MGTNTNANNLAFETERGVEYLEFLYIDENGWPVFRPVNEDGDPIEFTLIPW
jgi:hypothetical protein